MENYSYQLTEEVFDAQEAQYNAIRLKITIDKGKFGFRSPMPFTSVSDGTTTVQAFSNDISGNQKEWISYFTTDAFESMLGEATIEFGYGDEIYHTFTAVDLNTEISPMREDLRNMNFPDADNDWLAALN